MTPSHSIDTLISLAALLVGGLIITLRRQKGIGFADTIGFAACLVVAALTRFILTQVKDTQLIIGLVILLSYIFGCFPAFIVLITLGHLGPNKRSIFLNSLLLALIPFVVIILYMTYLVLSGFLVFNDSRELGLKLSMDLLAGVMPVYTLGLLVATLSLLIVKTNQDSRAVKTSSLLWLVAAIILTILLALGSFIIKRAFPLDGADLLLIGYLFVGVALLFTRPVTLRATEAIRADLFDSFCDGMILVDKEDVILDMNPVAEGLLGIPIGQARGNPVALVLENWKSISGASDAKEVEFRGSLNLNEQWRYISVRINRLDDDRGRVILLRDITDRRDTHEARQHAREEMFNLLRSFFKSAHTSQTSNEFFRDVLLQVAYTFRAESGVVCLVDSSQDAKKFKYTLMAKQGTLVQDNDDLSVLYEALEASGWSSDYQGPLVIPDAGKDEHFSGLVQPDEGISIVVVPLLYYEQLMGVLILTRSVGIGFLTDEIVRLGVVTEELASFIYSDRKRKADIALAERHRLSQDLHDSITQKLVGLLQLTEAVKLGLRSGAPVEEKRIDRISESARQALREMRLFLFELTPVDLEKDGLLSAVQSRLASVEGRSDIQARMWADDDIVLTAQETTEIYYIVQEALNNILKHANAKTVSIKLKQRKESVYLEIVDNGCGFDPAQVKEGGRGLSNIRERAKRINGKLKITSSPEHGTKITLVVPKSK